MPLAHRAQNKRAQILKGKLNFHTRRKGEEVKSTGGGGRGVWPGASERSMTQLCTLSTGKKGQQARSVESALFHSFFFLFEQRSTLYWHTHTQP